jgi:hypothetical protein
MLPTVISMGSLNPRMHTKIVNNVVETFSVLNNSCYNNSISRFLERETLLT